MELVSTYRNQIEIICNRFNNAISHLDIIEWLTNFKEEDWTKALIVLSNFEYYSTNDVIREYDLQLQKIEEWKRNKKTLYIIPVEKIGKSGYAMM